MVWNININVYINNKRGINIKTKMKKNDWTIAIIFLLTGWNSFRIYEINNMEIVGWMSAVAFIGTIIYAIKGISRKN